MPSGSTRYSHRWCTTLTAASSADRNRVSVDQRPSIASSKGSFFEDRALHSMVSLPQSKATGNDQCQSKLHTFGSPGQFSGPGHGGDCSMLGAGAE